MGAPINFYLPPAVQAWLAQHHPGQRDQPLRDAIRKQPEYSSIHAYADSVGTSLNGAFRLLALREYPELASVWPAPRLSKSRLDGYAAMRRAAPASTPTPEPIDTTHHGAVARQLVLDLIKDAPKLSTRLIQRRLHIVLAAIEERKGGPP